MQQEIGLQSSSGRKMGNQNIGQEGNGLNSPLLTPVDSWKQRESRINLGTGINTGFRITYYNYMSAIES